MTTNGSVSGQMIPRIAPLYRFQWEEAQNAYVLLFPEGMVQLNATAGEILRRCNNIDTVAQIIDDLQRAFQADEIGAEVDAFLQSATDNGWLEWREGVAL
jgi:pyrroloquinoline quinone biosynthesis protein D